MSVRRLSRRTDTDNQHICTMTIASKEIPELTEKDKLRFWAKVNKEGPTVPYVGTKCWDWTGWVSRNGYAQFRVSGVRTMVHRISYALFHGRTPCDLFVLHRCDRPSCVNPDHLIAGTQKENLLDMLSKGRGRQPSGEKAGASKLTEAIVIEMRRRHSLGEDCARLGREFNVTKSTARFAVLGHTWKCVK